MLKLWYILIVWFLTAPVLVWADHDGTSGGHTGGGSSGGQTGDAQPVLTDPINAGSVQEIANRIINFLFILAGPVAVIMIVYAGYLFLTATDNEEQVKKARKTILYVVIGIAVLVLSKAVIYVALDVLKGPTAPAGDVSG